jgi:hypothetical protein
MSFSLRPLLLACVLLATAGAAGAADKDGLQYDVQKTVLDKADTRGYDVNTSRLDRYMGLKVSLRNMTFKEMPAGEITWEILNRKYLSTSVELSSGTDKLPAIKPSEKIELTLGSANVQGYRDGAMRHMDELEWQLTIKREGKEVFRANSTKSFDAIAKRATKVKVPKP